MNWKELTVKAKMWAKIAQTVWDYWRKLKDNPKPPPPSPAPGDIPIKPPAPANDHRASFLFDAASVRVMNILSPAYTDAQFRAIVERCVNNGDDLVYLYVGNNGDGGGATAITSIYAGGGYGGAVDHNAVTAMRKRMQHCLERGLAVIAWLTADDSPAQYKAPVGIHLEHVRNCVREFSDLVAGWVVGLEMDSDGRKAHAAAMIAEGRKLDPTRSWGVHLNPGKTSPLYGADALYYQISGFNPKSVSRDAPAFGREIKSVRAKLPANVKLIAAEYSGSSDHPNARALGWAAIANGADGTGTGR
jgi:hypothetical protein